MPFSVFYNTADVAQVVAEFGASDLTDEEKAFGAALWAAGAHAWQTAPIETDPIHANDDPDCRRLDIDGGYNGAPITLQQVRDFLFSRATGNPYMYALAVDMGGESGAIEWGV